MAQTKRKRRSKHRGNAAGTIEARGRTGRKPSPEDQKKADKAAAREKRTQRLAQPPTWNRADAARRRGRRAAVRADPDRPFQDNIKPAQAIFVCLSRC